MQPNDTNSQIRYDANGNPTEITDAEGNTIQLKFDSTYGNLEWIQDAKGNTMRYRYDSAGNLSEIEYADGSKEIFSTNGQGDLASYTNRRGETIAYSYTNDGLIAQQTTPGETPVQYTYDVEGKLLSVVDDQSITTLTYDANDRLSGLTYPNGRSLNFEYDAVGRRTQIRGSDGYIINYSYDTTGNLQNLTNGNNELIVEYRYDAAGRPERENKGNGTYTTYKYSAYNQLESLTHYAPDGAVNSRFDYTYDALGRQNGVTTFDGIWKYEYDSLGQLTHADFTSTNSQIANQALTYIYDVEGNRIRTIHNGEITEYDSNNLNQYKTVGDTTYLHDNDGNLIEKTEQEETWRYVYNSENQLIKVTAPNGSITEYEYDVFGGRTATIQDGQRTEYLVDPFGLGDVVAEYSNNSLVAQYIHGFGLESQINAAGSIHYYDFDLIGSTSGVTNTSGSYVNRYNYQPFGQKLFEDESVNNPFEFIGQWGVSEEPSELLFMRARYYDSRAGRFTSVDPIGTSGGKNLYEYAENRPTEFLDPVGEIAWFIVWPLLKTAGIGASVGGGLNLADQLLQNDGRIDCTNWMNVGESALWGAGSALLLGPQSRLTGVQQLGARRPGFSNRKGKGKLKVGWSWNNEPKLFRPRGYGFSFRRRKHYDVPGGMAGGRVFTGGLGWMLFGPSGESHSCDSSPAQELLELPRGTSQDAETSNSFASITPEDKFGPEGYDAPGTPEAEKKRLITAAETFQYRDDFWNDPDAIVPTQTVIIKDQLDPNLDWSTFNFTNFGFLDWHIDVPGGQTINTRVDMRPKFDLAVDVNASFDAATGEITWTFQAVDPVTGDYPEDIFAGFLPPFNEETEYELGWVEFTVDPKDNLTTGTQIANQAFVQFDLVNDFNPAPKEGPWINTIDTDAPDSTGNALAAEVTSDFAVAWSGTDIGSGLATYDIYVSQDGGDFTLWLDDTFDTSATYTGDIGSTYAFYSVASDNVGLTESAPALADATTLVTAPSETNAVVQADSTFGSETIIEATGTASLVDTLTGYRIDSAGGSVNLTDQGQPITATSNADWLPLGVELNGGGFEIIASNGNNNFELWEISLSGGLISKQDILANQLNPFEIQFNQDFNNNGFIGTVVDVA